MNVKKYSIFRIVMFIVKSTVYTLIAFLCRNIISDSIFPYSGGNLIDINLCLIFLWEYILVFFIPVALFSVAEILLYKKCGTPIIENYLPLVVSVIIVVASVFVTNGQTIGAVVVALILLTMRFIISIIDLIVRKKPKFIIISILLIVLIIPFYSGIILNQDELRASITGTPDATGAWGSINQNIERADDWQQIVTDSAFKINLTDEKCEDDYGYICYSDTYPVIDGSTVCVPLAVEFARQHLGMDDETANSFVNFSTTHEAYVNLMDEFSDQSFFINDEYYKLVSSGEGTDIVLGTQPSGNEIKMAEERGVTFVKKAVCHDAFVFITHKNNPVDSLTVQQIREIYSGDITNWKDVGGKNKTIKAYQRETDSGSQTAMEELVMQGRVMKDPIEVPIIVGMGELIDAVAEYKNSMAAIGYTYKYYIDTLYKNDDIKVLAVDGIEPTDENIRSGAYPFSISYYGVIRQGDENETGGKFLDWILSEEGQKCVEQAGYIPVDSSQ